MDFNKFLYIPITIHNLLYIRSILLRQKRLSLEEKLALSSFVAAIESRITNEVLSVHSDFNMPF